MMTQNASNSKSLDQALVQVCSCYDVSHAEVLTAIQEGVKSVEQVSDLTYACQGCGGCRPLIEGLIAQAETVRIQKP
ncbi:MAG: (2Fe-2S)-binding protein [Thiomicrorhabdus chilensis]|uniref:(2Fe-2S)-binding protein n=1 Tax=Thiomicrorhabdus chilensis TaxID=63656 RepID=UPI00299F489E|nr:(2Fe-2S)-binding protein [Thiomicrorhabdus chilensis]MDX1346829.1 (2Fe-2S)-binding protein [Thiomicrorhabdus chilensis]